MVKAKWMGAGIKCLKEVANTGFKIILYTIVSLVISISQHIHNNHKK